MIHIKLWDGEEVGNTGYIAHFTGGLLPSSREFIRLPDLGGATAKSEYVWADDYISGNK